MRDSVSHQCLRLRRQAQGVPTLPCSCYCTAEQLVVQGCSCCSIRFAPVNLYSGITERS